MAEGRWMNARFKGTCGECGDPIAEGDRIVYVPLTKTALCAGEECGQAIAGEDPEAE